MGQIDELWRYDGRRVVVTGCASGIGEHVARQLTELGAEVVGLDLRRPALQLKEFHEIDLSDPASLDQAAASRENATVTVGLVDTVTMAEGIEWCRRNPEAVADGDGYRLSKEAMILY